MEKNNKYEELEISVIEFENTDVITSSECPNETPDVPMKRRMYLLLDGRSLRN